MEKKPSRFGKLAIRVILVFLGTVAFACSLAAEFKKVKAKDMKLDGSLCSLPRSPAFGLGITAAVCLSIAQIVGTSQVGTRLCSGEKNIRTSRILSIAQLVASWMSFGLALVLLATGSSMNGGQPYGKGWMDGKCYVVRNGVFIGAAILAVVTVVFLLGYTFTAGATTHHRTGADEEGRVVHQQQKVTDRRSLG
ncbi:protein MODIFYING WALL LIGNIN-1 [Phoenix dactylifera]|uniref:Protein MODIFYING WALL LIGNIN-1 n=1 Tax=Phoenix dactylifera TaxID=42345 RepID=A0A8B7CF86_PHODC|nr:protein MODIFYING WALL LIGNIN-1 [Phoenix dactylifera]